MKMHPFLLLLIFIFLLLFKVNSDLGVDQMHAHETDGTRCTITSTLFSPLFKVVSVCASRWISDFLLCLLDSIITIFL